FLAGKKRWNNNIKELQSRMAEMVDEPLFSTAEFTDYIELFREFSKRFKEQIIIVIDEFPYLHDSKRDIESMFQKIYDEIISESEITLILCGSSVSMMESLLGYKSPLYGRRTGQWLVEPLRFKDVCKFVLKYDIQNCIETYAVLGGIPFYLSMFNDNNSVLKNIDNMLLSKGSVLQREPEFLLMEEIREPRNYFLILKAIAFGNTRSSEIINTTGLDKSVVSRYIDVLHNLRIVKKSTPITIKKENVRDIRYYLNDNLFNFWFKFIYPNESQIEYGNTDALIQTIKSQLDVHTSFVFEDVSQEFLYEIIDDLPFRFERIGKWWHKDNEIDLLAFNEESRDIMFIECKWKNRKIGVDVIEKLMNKTKHVEWKNNNRHEHFCIISKNGLTKNAEQFAKENGVLSFDIRNMKKVFNVGDSKV
ncbi:MAG: ATP-binding protein, partial [Methanosarcinaceae archaeon]|nr:ATP-binding protein [Methanosarcinaceae archaeon]